MDLVQDTIIQSGDTHTHMLPPAMLQKQGITHHKLSGGQKYNLNLSLWSYYEL